MNHNCLIVHCPHCHESIIIEQINCRIFRHGVYKSNGQQIDPHSTKRVCDEIVQKQLIYGCGKPFFINDRLEAIICDYI